MTTTSAGSGAQQSGQWTTRRLLSWLREHFTAQGVEPARIIAEMLLAHVIGTERIALYMEPERPALPEEREQLRELVRRATRGEPVQFLVGWTTFYSERIDLQPVTQIPQPCTEELVARVVRALRDRPQGLPQRLADIGTGSGCIAIALARAFPLAQIVAVDLHEEVCALARHNVQRLSLSERIEVRCGDLCGPLMQDPVASGESVSALYDAIVSNPPYIPDAEWNGDQVEQSVKQYVPERALRGGADGLDLIRRLIAEAPALLAEGGIFACELADSHAEAAQQIAEQSGAFERAEILRDDEGYRRILRAVVK